MPRLDPSVFIAFLRSFGLTKTQATLGFNLAALAVLLIVAWASNFIAKHYLSKLFHELIAKIDKRFAKNIKQAKVLDKIAYLAPSVILYSCIGFFNLGNSSLTTTAISVFRHLIVIYVYFNSALALTAFLKALEQQYNMFEVAKKRPIKTYMQVLRIVIFFSCTIFIASEVTATSPWKFLTTLGAATAVLAFVFKDPLMGFVSSIQLSAYDMIRIGDWITMQSFDADGTVMEISLTTVKVRNFDKSITTIPTNALLLQGVKNWRGMDDARARRMKRSIPIDASSIQFCTPEHLDTLSNDPDLATIVAQKKAKLKTSIGDRSLTNLGLFREYALHFLRQNNQLHQNDPTVMVRTMQATDTAVPLEIIAFTKETDSIIYENVQSDIFDHLFAALPLFHLKPAQALLSRTDKPSK